MACTGLAAFAPAALTAGPLCSCATCTRTTASSTSSDCCVDGKGEKMATGSYSNLFSVIPRDGQTSDVMLEASRDPLRRRLQTVKVCVRMVACERGL